MIVIFSMFIGCTDTSGTIICGDGDVTTEHDDDGFGGNTCGSGDDDDSADIEEPGPVEEFSPVTITITAHSREDSYVLEDDVFVSFLDFSVVISGSEEGVTIEKIPVRMIGDLNPNSEGISENSLGEALNPAHRFNYPAVCSLSVSGLGTISDNIRIRDNGIAVFRDLDVTFPEYYDVSVWVYCNLVNSPLDGDMDALAMTIDDVGGIVARDSNGLLIPSENIFLGTEGVVNDWGEDNTVFVSPLS